MTETEPCPERRAGVDDVDFVARGAGGDRSGILADRQFAIDPHIDHVVDGYRSAAAVGDVGVFAVVWRELGKVVGAAGGEGQEGKTD